MKLADALTATLRDWHLKYVFGVGGANIEHLYDSIHRLGHGKLKTVGAKSEIGAAFMADCRARTHRTLGVCCATSGGGMMNLAVGIAESFAESIPVLAIVGQPPRKLAGRGAFQDSSGIGRSVDADSLWSAISKFHTRIDDPKKFWQSLELAARAALNGRSGPTGLLVPRDLFDCEVEERPSWFPNRFEDLVAWPDAPPQQTSGLFDAICTANNPVLLLGNGADRCSNPAAIAQFARRAGIRVVTTLSTKNSFPCEDPLHLGMVGVAGEPAAHRYLIEESDLIVGVGTDLSLMVTQPIQAALQPERLALVNTDMSEALRIVVPRIAIEADPGAVFAKLNRLCDRYEIRPRTNAPIVSTRYVSEFAPSLPQEENGVQSDPAGSLLQSDALEVLQQFLPQSGHILFDAGNCSAAALHYLRVPQNVSTTVALGMGGMGYAIAGAIGAQIGSPRDSQTMVICGDGAFFMLGAEVNTAVHYQLPILFIVFNNGMHGMCVTRQQLYFEGRIEASRYPTASIAEMARGMGPRDGLWVASAETADELTQRLSEFREHAEGPGVIELRLGQEQIPPFTPFLAADAPTYEPETLDAAANQ